MAIYIGVGGKARKVVGGYIGVNGKAAIIYNGGSNLPSGYVPYTYIHKTSSNAELSRTYVPTGYYLNTYTQVICDFKLGQNNSSSQQVEFLFLILSTYYAYIIRNSSNVYKVYIRKGSSEWTSGELSVGTTYNINMTKNTNGDCYFNNTKVFSNIETLGSTDGIYPMYYGNTSNSSQMLYLKGLSCYDLINKKELIHLEPCNYVGDGSSIKAGVYNSIDNTFHSASSNSDNGYFICTN